MPTMRLDGIGIGIGHNERSSEAQRRVAAQEPTERRNHNLARNKANKRAAQNTRPTRISELLHCSPSLEIRGSLARVLACAFVFVFAPPPPRSSSEICCAYARAGTTTGPWQR